MWFLRRRHFSGISDKLRRKSTFPFKRTVRSRPHQRAQTETHPRHNLPPPRVFTAGVLLVLPGVSSIDPDGTSLPSSAPVSLAGDIPRQPEITSSMAGCFLERPVERNEEIHDRDDEEEDSDLGLESDLALNGFEILETLPPFDSKSLPETPRSPPPPPASERGRGGGLLDLRDRRWLLFSSTAIEAARERRRSWRQEAHTPPVLVRSTVCLYTSSEEKKKKKPSLCS
ncbi:hypothetical protein Bca52824_082506 [Brassica carinata]|uniref:Uncharacterized protein n=1 Tax=Brassica carinata TaxID=52824 RepID=A0A8X7PJI8_BRACI|nr:hypothetical protein Bca52824_082506 [Brassica carinata]